MRQLSRSATKISSLIYVHFNEKITFWMGNVMDDFADSSDAVSYLLRGHFFHFDKRNEWPGDFFDTSAFSSLPLTQGERTESYLILQTPQQSRTRR